VFISDEKLREAQGFQGISDC